MKSASSARRNEIGLFRIETNGVSFQIYDKETDVCSRSGFLTGFVAPANSSLAGLYIHFDGTWPKGFDPAEAEYEIGDLWANTDFTPEDAVRWFFTQYEERRAAV